ncbi:50S ribosomal protein L25 [Candidatus Bipolaricaulota bacterium]|nr:50S ribosomal protein L25 [Candidatus Bipolaricaulota bacterium]
MITVKATRRSLGVKARALRRRGLIPAVLYGAHLDPVHVALPEPDVRRLFSQITRSTMVELQVDGEIYRVFVKDVQVDPITTQFLHLDFYVPEAGRALELSVPVKIEGEAPGVKEGGVLEVLHPEIPVEAPPEKIPPHIVVDVSKLGLDEAILVRDLPWPEGVRPLLPPEDAVVVVVPPKVAAEAAPAEAAPPEPTASAAPETKSS